jgi:hypothetical protein
MTYLVSFYYPGPYRNIPGNDSASVGAEGHNYTIEELLKDANFEFQHKYFWTDGSCFKLIKFDGDSSELQRQLELMFEAGNHSYRVLSIKAKAG